jgi:hypothetical protein
VANRQCWLKRAVLRWAIVAARLQGIQEVL